MARTVQYLDTDGSLTSESSAARRASPGEILGAASGASWLPPGYFLGWAEHEAAMVINTVETEPSGFQSIGLLQVSQEEAREAGTVDDVPSLCDLATNVKVGAYLAERNFAAIQARQSEGHMADFLCYTAWAHVNGLSTVLGSIDQYGLDWAALKARDQNEWMRDRMIPYAEDCVRRAREFPGGGQAPEGDSVPPSSGGGATLAIFALFAIGLLSGGA